MSEEESDEIIDDEEIDIDNNNEQKKILNRVFIQDRIFADFLSLSEFIQVVCTRSEQINRGGKIYTTPCINSIDIAIQEILEKQCPLVIYRKRGQDDFNEYIEAWDVNELSITQKCISQVETILDKNKTVNIVEKLNNLLNL